VKLERPLVGGAPRIAAKRIHLNANTREPREVAVTEADFCACGHPYVNPRRGGPRYCIPNRHPEPPRQLLVRGPSGRPWWREVGP